MSDTVNKPAHYTQGGIETIDSIRASTGDGFIWYCVGNADKYIGRCRYKGKLLEDLRKCRDYVDWAIEEAEKLEAAVESGNCPAIPDSSDRKPLAIPSGWRELEPDEVPLATDMHEWMGGWYYRNDDATNEYKWHGSRHIRKIEPDEPKPLEIPAGWRELHNGEKLSKTDLYDFQGKWTPYVDFDPAGSDTPKYDKTLHHQHIRKIETANPSEAPNRWAENRQAIPIPEGWRELLAHEVPKASDMKDSTGAWLARGGDSSSKYLYCAVRHIRKIEAANTPENPDSSSGNPSENPNSSTATQWIPKVGDKVRVVGLGLYGEIEYANGIGDHCWLVLCQDGSFRWLSIKGMELIEAAK